MSTHVVMPQLGESVIEGTVGKWFKKVGDNIDQYEPIMEVVTDKVTTEIPSPAAGTITEIIVPEGSTVKAGTVLAVIDGALNDASNAPPSGLVSQPSFPPPPMSLPTRHEMPSPEPVGAPSAAVEEPGAGDSSAARRLTPVVSRMIAENKISDAEFATIAGTGGGGRVTKKDIENFLANGQRGGSALTAEPVPTWEQPGTGELFRPTEEIFKKPTEAKLAPPPSAPKPVAAMKDEIVPVSPMRKSIADHMVRSKAISPHVTSVHEADMARVLSYQKKHEEEFARQGVKLTFTAFFVQAAVAALKAWPVVNASYSDQGITMHKRIHIGIAVAIEDGLIVPVLKAADDKSLLGIARAVNDLATRAREKKLLPDDVQGGTFTLTNFGIFGSLFGMPIINQPQSAILGVGAIQKRAVVINDAIAIRPMCYFSITIDHRLLDGAIGDQFMNVFKKYLEEYPASRKTRFLEENGF